MKKFLIFFLIFFFVSMPVSEAKKMYAPDLTVSRYTLNSGSFTISNPGSKNSPAGGFDVLLYYKNFDGSTYKQIYHSNLVIAPGYSRNFKGVFDGSTKVQSGLIRVNPYKRFQEWSYTNNVRYFKLINKNIDSYVATEQSRYDGGEYWEYTYYSYNFGYAWANGNSTTCLNGKYSPLLSTNPIAAGYNYWNSRLGRWEWVSQPLYVNAVQIASDYGGNRYRSNYVAVSGVTNNSHMHIYVDVGFAKHLTYNAAKGIWEAYIDYRSGKLKDRLLVKIYSDQTGQAATDDIVAYVSNVKVWTSYIKNAWTWTW